MAKKLNLEEWLVPAGIGVGVYYLVPMVSGLVSVLPAPFNEVVAAGGIAIGLSKLAEML